MTNLAVRDLTKTYGEGELAVDAVRHVDLTIDAGEVVLIMGPSGSGKTTLLLMLGAMLRPTSGSITVDGVDLASAPERSLPPLRARHFGFVFQDFNLLSALTALENVELACNLAGVHGYAARQRAADLLTRMGLADRLRFRPDQLSGGEKQRVAIARALANNATVILADEPTANLDSAHGREIARQLRQLAAEDGRSVVIVSHDDRLREIADRVLWLEDGRFHELAAMVTDPVCGMAVDTTSLYRHDAHGRSWWFCSSHCRDEYAANPDAFRAAGPDDGLYAERVRRTTRVAPMTSASAAKRTAPDPTSAPDQSRRRPAAS
jgi:putative ABC transport system ATP-binding protein